MHLKRLAAIGLVVAASACGDSTGTGGGGNGGASPCANSGADLVIGATAALAFSPRNPSIPVVCWEYRGGPAHTVTSDEGVFASNLGPGQKFEFTFTTADVYPYHCVPHLADGMTGTITVTAP